MGLKLGRASALLVTLGLLSSTQGSASNLVAVGNGVFKPQALERLVRASIASALDGSVHNNRLDFKFDGMSEKANLPEITGNLKSIFDILGIKKELTFGVSPIQARFTLPDSNLKLNIQSSQASTFVITAEWSLTQLSATADALSIKMPKGLFDQAAVIKSSPVQISLKSNSPDVKVSLTLTAQLTDQGAKIKLNSITTNLLAARHPEFAIKIGRLTINGAPLELTIQTNGQSLVASEPTIRAEFQTLEQTYADKIRIEFAQMLRTQIAQQLRTLETTPSLAYKISTDEELATTSLTKSAKDLFQGMDVSLILSYLQSVSQGKAYSAQLSSQVCFDGQCVGEKTPTTQIGTEDIKSMSADADGSVILYESFFQNLIHSEAFQKRIATYFQNEVKSPGVELAPAGIKIYFEPSQQALVAILNLEIDIKKTAGAGSPLGLRIKRDIGDWIEAGFGSGKLVKIPVPIVLSIKGMTVNEKGESELTIMTDMPDLRADGTFVPFARCSAQDCPDNVSKMTKVVRKDFIPSVKAEISKSLPKSIQLPIGTTMKFKTLDFKPKNILFTPNRGLMLTVGIE